MRITQLVQNLQPVFILGQLRTDNNLLAITRRPHVFEITLGHRPGIARFAHLRIVVADLAQKRRAGQLEILQIMAMPGHMQHVDIMKRNLDADLHYRQHRCVAHEYRLQTCCWMLAITLRNSPS
ncbi:hypothetical protein D3C78_1610580 [compost metagenome]